MRTTHNNYRGRLAAILSFALVALALAGCGGGSTADTTLTPQPPTIGGSPTTSIQTGHAYSFTPTTTDPSGGALTFSIASKPSWAAFSTSTGALTGTPASGDVGTTSGIVISVSDGTNSASLPSFAITVTATASGPTISGTPGTSVQAGSAYSFTPTTTNPSGGTLTFSITNKPSWANFSTTTGMLSGTPASTDAGTTAGIVIAVSDGTNSASLPSFSLTVTTQAASPPTISGTPPSSIQVGSTYSFTPTTTDPSGGTLTFTITGKPAWATFSATTGQLSGVPQSADVGTDTGIAIKVSDGTNTATLPTFSITVNAASGGGSTGAPLILYTDLASGPTSGGENNKGTYLSIFGINFGSTGLGTTVKVYIGGVEVDNYRYLGASKGRPDVQQITVQVGSLGGAAAAAVLPVMVSVNGVNSNTDQTFMVNPGRILFVDNVNGNDSTAVVNDITHPYRHVQTSSTSAAAFGAMQPGDVIVMRGTGTPWTDLGNGGYFIKFYTKGGSQPTGASGTGPVAVIPYPTEDVFIDMANGSGVTGGISSVDTQNYSGGNWVTIADLRIESGGNSGVVNLQIGSKNWRVVNNEITAATATNSALAGGITGNGPNSFWVGNHIHNIAGGSNQENHAMYIDGDGSYEIAYNLVENVTGGNGFQIYVDGTNGSNSANNVNLHHNTIHDVSKHGINIADGSTSNIRVWNNVVYNTSYAGLRFNTTSLTGAKIYNNTFYNTNSNGSSSYGPITNDWNLTSSSLDLENNIFWPSHNAKYWGGDSGLPSSVGTNTNNLWYGGTGSTGDAHAVSGNPAFVTAGTDFHLTSASPAVDSGSSTVSSVVTTDYDLTPRPQPSGGQYDVGAYEYH